MNDSIIKRHEKMTIKIKKCHHTFDTVMTLFL